MGICILVLKKPKKVHIYHRWAQKQTRFSCNLSLGIKKNSGDDKKQKQIVKKAEERLPLALRTDGIAREEERKNIQERP